MDYSLPAALGRPDVEVFQNDPSTVTLGGAKGVGESGTIGSYAAVNALNGALLGTGAEVNIAPAAPDAIFLILNASGFKAAPSA